MEVEAGSSVEMLCQTDVAVEQCQWSWRQLNQTHPWNLEVKRISASGNDSNDCSIKVNDILPEQEGFWTCGARQNVNNSFTLSTPIKLIISKGKNLGLTVFLSSILFFNCLFGNFF